MTQLLAELDKMIQEKQAFLLQEKNNALMFLKIERIASITGYRDWETDRKSVV